MPGEPLNHPGHKNLSCQQCRRRKTKCDRAYPCAQCILRGQETECTPVKQAVYVPAIRDCNDDLSSHSNSFAPPFPHDSPIDVIGARLNKIEATLGVAVEKINRVADAVSQDPPRQTDSSEVKPPLRKRQKTQTVSDGISEQFQSLIEDAVMGHNVKVSPQNKTSMRSSSNVPSDDPMYENSSILDQRTGDPPIDIAFAFLQLCPDRKCCEILIKFYFDYVDWTTRVLNIPQCYESFLQISRLPVLDAIQEFQPATICCFLICIALSLHFATEKLLNAVRMSKNKAVALAESLFCGCQQLLWASNFLATHDLQHLSCVVLMGLYQNSYQSQAYAHWTLLGSAIKVAQNLRCNKIDDKGILSHGDPMHHYLHTAVDREVGRRIWWNLLWLDWSHATAHGGVYSANPAQNRTSLPQNTIIDHENVTVKDDNMYTPMTFTISRMRYVEVYRHIVDTRNQNDGPLSKSQIKDIMRRLTSVHESTPECLKFDDGNLEQTPEKSHTQEMEMAMLELIFQNRVLRLHRTYQFAGYYQEHWNFARVESVNAAKIIIRIIERYSKRYPMLLGYWLVVFYLLGAATSVVFELCCSPHDSENVHSCREYVRTSLDILRSVEDCSDAASNSLHVLEELRLAEDKIREEFVKKDSVDRMTQALREGKEPRLRHIFHDLLSKSLRVKKGLHVNEELLSEQKDVFGSHTRSPTPLSVSSGQDPQSIDQQCATRVMPLEYDFSRSDDRASSVIDMAYDNNDTIMQTVAWAFDTNDWV